MGKEWRKDFDFQRPFIPEMKRIIGEHLISEATAEEDQSHNTDLIVLRLEAVRIACRVRKFQYLPMYGHQITIRYSRPNGKPTEYQKMSAGWGDYILYGFSNQQGDRLARWVLGDLRVFRQMLALRQGSIFRASGQIMANADGSSCFIAYTVKDLPSAFIVASHGYELLPRQKVLAPQDCFPIYLADSDEWLCMPGQETA